MNFRKSQAIVLHGRRWSESSLILTCITADYGKVSVVSKGVRRPKSNVAPYHIPGAHVELIWIHQPQRDLFSLVSIDPVERLQPFTDIARFNSGMRLLKLVRKTTMPESPHLAGFHQLLRSLHALSDPLTDPALIYWQFTIRWFAEMGFPWDLAQCNVCGHSVRGNQIGYLVEQGSGICNRCLKQQSTTQIPNLLLIGGETFAILKKLETMPERGLHRISVSERSREEIELVCNRFSEYHLGFQIRLKPIMDVVSV